MCKWYFARKNFKIHLAKCLRKLGLIKQCLKKITIYTRETKDVMSDLRCQIDGFISSGNIESAVAGLARLWRTEPTTGAASFIATRATSLRGRTAIINCRLAILRSFTVEPMVPILRAAAFVAGIDLDVQLGEFNAWAQEMVDPESALYLFQPTVVILAVSTRDQAQGLWNGDGPVGSDALEIIQNCVCQFRKRSNAHLIIHGLELPSLMAMGIYDSQIADGQYAVIARINDGLRALARSHRSVYFLDYDAVVARVGRNVFNDERKSLTVRLPIAAGHLQALTSEWLRYLHPISGRIAKCLVIDLDNTLWGGVIGEDGMSGICLGAEYPGAAFQAVQRTALALNRRGILLAIASKNNPTDALEVLRNHPGMILNLNHFAAIRINWNDKAQSLREIAQELNISLDALAFFDDNPVERQNIICNLPEVTVIEVPSDPWEYARALGSSPVFERLSISSEDLERTEMYAAERVRNEVKSLFTSRDDFYRSLGQEVEFVTASSLNLPRIAQLTQKTNQFNLTTRRYSEQELDSIGSNVFAIHHRDRYGDNGLVGVAVLSVEGQLGEVDAFMISCRVIGRQVETAFLSNLVSVARMKGIRWLSGWFLPTKKNSPARDFYSDHGFTLVLQDGEASRWTLDLDVARIDCPEFIICQDLRAST